ncbi:hypothetical protein DRP98_06125 [candidate division KSB1 bacterium]|nr:MAG: hypothetical protein DRP98_06125 [candidate division KSB1 bacterium]
MKRNRYFLLYFFLFLAVVASSSVQAGSFVIAKYGGDFLAIGVGARALGMGAAYVAVGQDGIAAYWNPAGLTQLNYPQINAMHSERFAGVVKYDYLGIYLPYGPTSTVGISFIRLGVDDIPITALNNPDVPLGAEYEDEYGNKLRNTPYITRWVNDAEYAGFFSYGYRFCPKWMIGANVKLIWKTVGDNSAWGLGFDAGMLYNPINNLQLGVNIQDFTTTLVAWDTGRNELIIPNLKWGGAYSLRFSNFGVIVAADFDTRFEKRKFAAQKWLGPISVDFHYGAELNYKKIIYGRIGSDVGNFTLGAGIQLPKLKGDLAFLPRNDLGNTWRLSLTLTIEEEKFKR